MHSRKRLAPATSLTALEPYTLPRPVLKPSLSAALPVAVPLLGLGLLLLTASGLSALRVSWLAFTVPLYAHRLNLATVGIAAFALAFLWLNIVAFL